MNIITVTKENLDQEHICCAISNNKDIQVASKKSWLTARFDDGLVFKKGDVRGKCFIEYIPAEKAWVPIDAAGYMYIDCLWVSGQFKGHGYSSLLLDECISDSKAKGKQGIVVLSSSRKMSFLSDPSFLRHKGFVLSDTAKPYFELFYLPFDKKAEKPRFCLQESVVSENRGFELYYTHQCPFTAKYVPIIENLAREKNLAFKSILIDSAEQAHAVPTPFTTYSLFWNGKFITHEILSENKFIKLLKTLGYE